MHHTRVLALATVVVATTALAACSGFKNADIKPAEVNPTDMPKGPGLFSGESGNILEGLKGSRSEAAASTNIGVNSYLWRSSLETVAFMPITQADSNGGVIVTDWYTSPSNPDERVKANILILGKQLRADALKVSLFKQLKDKSGKWNDGVVAPGTVRALEDTILTKARALKVQTLNEK